MRELSLFSGGGGGLLATVHLLGWRPVGYVEWSDYRQRLLAQRIKDGVLPNAPIFGDIRTFLREGYAQQYQGLVDVLTAGFPCQPFSVAGKQRGADDPRNMWPSTIECIRVVRPRFAFLENVPGLLTSGYLGTILGDLAESGYDTRRRCLSAAELGAPHRRDRLWIVAHSAGARGGRLPVRSRQSCSQDSNPDWKDEIRDIADPRLQNGLEEAMARSPQGNPKLQLERSTWWNVEPDVDRLVHGAPSRVDRIGTAGDGQVPAVAAAAWLLLTEDVA